MEKFDILNFISTWSHEHTKFLIGVFVNIFLIWASCKILDNISKKIRKRMMVKITDYPVIGLIPIIFQTLKFLVAFLLIAGFMQSFGYNVTSIIAGFGITGLAVAFAAQTTIGNVFGSFSLLTDKVFKIGDFIKFDNYSGRIEGINLRSTSLRTVEGFLINVPNNVLANTPITNISQTSKYKIDVAVAIECDTPIETVRKAMSIISEILQEDKNIEQENTVVFIDSIEETAINIKLFGYTTFTVWKEYVKQKSRIIEEIIARFQQAGISFDVPDSRLTIVEPEAIPGVFKGSNEN